MRNKLAALILSVFVDFSSYSRSSLKSAPHNSLKLFFLCWHILPHKQKWFAKQIPYWLNVCKKMIKTSRFKTLSTFFVLVLLMVSKSLSVDILLVKQYPSEKMCLNLLSTFRDYNLIAVILCMTYKTSNLLFVSFYSDSSGDIYDKCDIKQWGGIKRFGVDIVHNSICLTT